MKSKIDWIALFFTVLLIVIAREGAVALMTLFGHPELGNLIGLALLLIVLVIWRCLDYERKCVCIFTDLSGCCDHARGDGC